MQFDFRLRWAQQLSAGRGFLLLDIHMLSYDPVGQKCQYHFAASGMRNGNTHMPRAEA